MLSSIHFFEFVDVCRQMELTQPWKSRGLAESYGRAMTRSQLLVTVALSWCEQQQRTSFAQRLQSWRLLLPLVLTGRFVLFCCQGTHMDPNLEYLVNNPT